jgi:rhodanese-related sulfurtransferase
MANSSVDRDCSGLGLCAGEVRRLIWEQVTALDARTAAEHLRCQIEGSLHVGIRPTARQLQRLGLDPTVPLICYSNADVRAAQLNAHLRGLGYRHVYNLNGGLSAFLSTQHA